MMSPHSTKKSILPKVILRMNYRFIAAVLSASLVLSACSLSLASDITPPPNYQSPMPAATLGPAYPAAPPDALAGAAIFAEKCAPCHGETGLGDGPQGQQLGVNVPALGTAELARLAAPAAWYAVVTQGRIDRFMPPFTSLSDAERWDVVAYALNLSAPPEQIASGRALYEANCTDCHGADGAKVTGANFSDPQYMAARSANELRQLTADGTSQDMPGFQGKLGEDELWAVTAYLQTLGLQPAAPAATDTSEPSATPTAGASPVATEVASPTVGAGTAQPTAETSTTPEATITPVPQPSPTAQGYGTVNGTVSDGSGGTLPRGLTAILHGFEHGATSGTPTAPEEVLTLESPVDADGTFKFENVEMPLNRLFYVSTDYNGTTFQSDFDVVAEGTSSLDLPVTIYDSTTDTSTLSISQAHILLDVPAGASTLQVVEFLIVANDGTRMVTSPESGGPVIDVALPEGATNLVFDDGSTLATSDRFVATEGGFGDTSSVAPGEAQHQIVFAYELPYSRKLDLSRTYALPVASGSVLVPEGVRFSGDNFTAGELRDLQGVTFTSQLWQNLPAGEPLTFTISGKPSASSSAPEPTSSRQGLLIGIGALGVALAAVGGWLFLRQRRREQELEAELEEGGQAILSDDDILDAIIVLDDQYRAGNISEDAYRQRREELKARLKKQA
jgi:mono/diheme cytochrome c family protein